MNDVKYTIGLDFGTLSGRAVLVRVGDGAEIADETLEYRHAVMDDLLAASGEKLPPEFALEDAADYEEVMKTVIPGVIKKSGVDPRDIIGIGIDFTCCTMLPIKSDLTPLSYLDEFRKNPHAYVKLWKHHAAQDYADRINAIAESRGEEFLKYYGGKISSEWLFPKIWEILDKAPEVYAAADGFIEAGDWATSMLCGKRIKSYAFSAAKAIYDFEKGYPSKEYFAALDPRLENVVEEKLNAPMIHTAESCGTVGEWAVRELGLAPGTVVACPTPDAHVATVGLGMKESGDMCGIMGTSSCYMLLGDDFCEVPGICGAQKDNMTPGFWGYEAGLCCFGDHFAWVADRLAPAEYRAAAEAEGIPLLKYMIKKAFAKKPGETGLIALDWWNGNRNILVDSSLSGLIVGMTLGTRAEDILRALVEATAFATRVIMENYRDHGVKVNRFIAAGGIARKDPYTMQLYSDVLGIEIKVADSSQVPAKSSAIYAAAASGIALDTCIDNMCCKAERTYRPDPEAAKVYDELYAEYVKLHDYFGRGGNDVMKRLRALKLEAGNN